MQRPERRRILPQAVLGNRRGVARARGSPPPARRASRCRGSEPPGNSTPSACSPASTADRTTAPIWSSPSLGGASPHRLVQEAGEDRAPDGDQPVVPQRRALRPDLDAEHPAVRRQSRPCPWSAPLGREEPEDEVGPGRRLPLDQPGVGVGRLEDHVREAEGHDRVLDERERPVERLRHAPRSRDREIGERHVRDLARCRSSGARPASIHGAP